MISEQTPRKRDEGVSLIELLVGVALFGLLLASLSAAIIVVLRQNDNSTGRLNNARSEQAVGLWMPTDLASAEKVNTDANASACNGPCPANVNLGGSSALYLEWVDKVDNGSTGVNTVTTRVSYRYVQVGTEWQLIRVACVQVETNAPSCRANVVVHNLDAPPSGQPWIPGTTVPSWVIQVSIPLDPADPGNTGTTLPANPNAKQKNAQRVVVTINGGGDSVGAGGGINQISLSAGGTNRSTITAKSTSGTPSFNEARSRCGGNVALVVDESGSIGSTSIEQVKTSITNFIDKFSGTPVQLEVVRFDTQSSILGTTTEWSKYFNMLSDTDVATLRAAVAGMRSNGKTNWEDALFRLFKNSDGTQATIVPDLVVFFTDGVPNVSRLNYSSSTASSADPARLIGFPASDGSAYNQEAFYRADTIAKTYRTQSRFIGVGVGPDINSTSGWYNLANPPGYHDLYERGSHPVWERSYHYQRSMNYQRSYHLQQSQNYQRSFHYQRALHYQLNMNYQRSFHYQRAMHYQTRVGSTGPYTNVTKAVYDLENRSNRKNILYPTVLTGTPLYWENITQATYNSTAAAVRKITYEATSGDNDMWETTTLANYTAAPVGGKQVIPGPTSNPSYWDNVTKAVYDAASTTKQIVNPTTPLNNALDYWENIPLATYTSTAAAMRRITYEATNGDDDFWETTTLANYNAAPAGGKQTLPGPTTNEYFWANVNQATYDATAAANRRKQYEATTGTNDFWETTTLANYNAAPPGGKQVIVGAPSGDFYWENISQTTYNSTAAASRRKQYEAPNSVNDLWEASTEALYNANNTTADSADGWRITATYSSPYTQWETTTKSLYNSNNSNSTETDGWRYSKSYTAPYDKFDPGTPMTNATILTQIIAGNDKGVPAIYDGTKYTNPQVADMYVLPEFTQLQAALEAVALAECGGTLTLQTKVGTAAAADPFAYQNTGITNAAGNPVAFTPSVVTTTRQFASGTFDFAIPNGQFVTVEIQPQNISDLTAYRPLAWACKAGPNGRTVTPVPISGSQWSGIKVRVAANEAVSCVQTVTRVTP